MKTLLAFSLCLFAIISNAANPSTKSFRASGGLTVTSNDVTGMITYDGSGVMPSAGTNATLAVMTNGVLVNVNATNINFVMGTNVVLTSTNIGRTANIGINSTISSNEVVVITAGYFITSQIWIPWLTTSNFTNLGTMTIRPPISAVQYNSNGVMQGNTSFIYTNDQVFLTNLPTNSSPIAFLAVDSGGGVYETAVPSGSGSGTPAPPLSSVQFNSNGVMQGSAGFIYTNGQVRVADIVVAGAGVEVTTGSVILNGSTTALVAWNGLGQLRWDADGVVRFNNDTALGLNRINLGGTDAASPSIGVTNGDVIILGANGAFSAIATNRLHVPGGIVLTNANVAAGRVWTAVGGLGGGTWSNAPSGGGSTVAPPLSSVQFNSNGVMQGSAAFLYTNGVVIATNFWDISDVRYWGAIPNDAVDDWQAIQSAIGFASTNGGTVKLPAGTNLYGRTIFLKSNVRIVGEPGAILARVSGMHQSRPYDALSTNAGLFATLVAVSRFYSTTGTYTNTATLIPNASYVGPHSNIYVGNITIYGASKTNGNLHQIASGAPVLGDINDVDAIVLDDCSDVLIENVTVPFASEHAVSICGNTSVSEGGSGRNIRIVNLTAVDVGMLIEAQEGVQDVTAINPVGTQVYIHGIRMNGVLSSKTIGGSIGPCTTGNALYYAQTGTHLAFGVTLAKTNTAELAVRIDGGAQQVTLIGNTINQGRISRAAGTSGVVVIQANRWMNNDARKQGSDLSGFINDSTGFIQLPETRVLIIDDTLPTDTNNSSYNHFIYSSTNNGILNPHNQSATIFDNTVLITSNTVGIGTMSPGNLLALSKVGANGTAPGIDFTSTLGSTSPNTAYSSGRIFTKFDGTGYDSARITLAYPDGGGAFQDGLSLQNGKVGIGSTLPSSSLDVTGQVRAASAIITNGLQLQFGAAPVTIGQVWAAGATNGAGMWTNATAGSFSVSGNSNQIPYLNVAGTGFLFNSRNKSAPGLGFQPSGNGNVGAVLLHVDAGEDTGLVQIGPPNPGSSISSFIPSLSISNRYDGGLTQEMVRVNYVDVGGTDAESMLQTWRNWDSSGANLVSYSGLRKDGQLTLAHGTMYPSNSFANTMPTAAQLGAGGFWTGISNAPNTSGTLVTVYSLNGTTTAMKVLAP